MRIVWRGQDSNAYLDFEFIDDSLCLYAPHGVILEVEVNGSIKNTASRHIPAL